MQRLGDAMHYSFTKRGESMGYRVFYRQGSFVLVDRCGTWDEALEHARRVQLRRGVWHLRIEDADGQVVHCHDLWEGLPTVRREATSRVAGESVIRFGSPE
jgi:hypothetical protein